MGELAVWIRYQIRAVSVFDDLAGADDRNLVRFGEGREAVGDQHGGTAGDQPIQAGLDPSLGDQV